MNFKNYIFRYLLLLVLPFLSPVPALAQPDVYFSYGLFNTPANEPFAETWLTIAGRSLAAGMKDGKLHNSVHIKCLIRKDSAIVKASKYNLSGPLFDSTASAPAFIDNQRYSLPNGEYEIELSVTDNFDTTAKAVTIRDKFSILFSHDKIQGSSIQPLESFRQAETLNSLTKSGFDLVPYTVNYYPESSRYLSFYFEGYNVGKVLGSRKPFVYAYYIETSDNGLKLNRYGSFRKQEASVVNPLLARMDISMLGTGNYNLVVELRDENNQLLLTEKYFFQRVNRHVDVAALQQASERQNLAEYFGRCNNADTLKMFVECLWPIADGIDKERIINQAVTKKPDMMKQFIVNFWERRAADTANPLIMWSRYYQEVQKVMVLFRCGKQPGYYTERGRVYLQYGPPSQRAEQPNEHNTFPYEIWQYYRLTDAVNGQFFSNRKFVFVNKNLGDDCYNLVHSDLRGEIYNPRWQFEVTRRNSRGIADPDNTTPSGTQHNQFNEIYNQPR